ncbi:hypothetical protein AVEN_184245-1 [Araneus ventricosus]|uniref:Uncharacterized protein n=1 Tax=Araneus ventricosus TaxID=182803 RepID=A0A4Y2PA22_ARAVE|nr:hypothetical protein AVEN_184245-1 [Araneus ventricosus]
MSTQSQVVSLHRNTALLSLLERVLEDQSSKCVQHLRFAFDLRDESLVVFQRCSSTLQARLLLKTPCKTHCSFAVNLPHHIHRRCGRFAEFHTKFHFRRSLMLGFQKW